MAKSYRVWDANTGQFRTGTFTFSSGTNWNHYNFNFGIPTITIESKPPESPKAIVDKIAQ